MKGRLLVAYSNQSVYVATTAEYLASFGRFSTYDVRYLHVTNRAKISCTLDEFDVVLHSYCARFSIPEFISHDYLRQLKQFQGIKILAVQDEYDRTSNLHRAISEFNFDIVLTCVPEQFREQIYPQKLFPRTQFVTVLTGYVPESLAEQRRDRRPIADRPIVIGYRGRDIGSRYGRLAFEKYEIGRRMREICVQRGIRHDIEVAEDKRIYGDDWYDFVESCRTMLGTESGSNVFDFDGSTQQKYEELTRRNGKPPDYDTFSPYTEAQERTIDMGQISPRIFEAAALRTPLILFSGKYSGIIEPGRHYIELEKDFSNIDAVIAKVSDVDALERIADRAYNDLIKSQHYSYRAFVDLIDGLIDQKLLARGDVRRRAVPAERHIGMNSAGIGERPTRVPRPEDIPRKYNELWKKLEHPSLPAKLLISALLPKGVVRLYREAMRRP